MDSLRLFGSQIAGDYVRWSVGHVLAEATERLVSEEMELARRTTAYWSAALRHWLMNSAIHAW